MKLVSVRGGRGGRDARGRATMHWQDLFVFSEMAILFRNSKLPRSLGIVSYLALRKVAISAALGFSLLRKLFVPT